MLSSAQAAVPTSIDIHTASFAISSDDLRITRNLLPLPTDRDWLERQRNTFLLSPIMGFGGTPAVPARRVTYRITLPSPALALPKIKTAVAIVEPAPLPAKTAPDPAPLGFLGLGLIALGLARRRKKREQAVPVAAPKTTLHDSTVVAM